MGGYWREGEAGAKVLLFAGVENAVREAGEIVGAGEEAGYSREMDDVGADI